MESNFSLLSSSKGEFKAEDYIQPHYKEAYRLAIDCLVKEGEASYRNFIKEEGICSFLSEEEINHITESAVQPPTSNHSEEVDCPQDDTSSTGTYWPTHSDTDPPNLDLGWPEFPHRRLETNIDLLFHPPRQNNPTIKEVIRKQIQDARQVMLIKHHAERGVNKRLFETSPSVDHVLLNCIETRIAARISRRSSRMP